MTSSGILGTSVDKVQSFIGYAFLFWQVWHRRKSAISGLAGRLIAAISAG
jgi:hypothetical protein|tara:strand:+ start:477 stop:626 length:150 start_codon:yes stop_codon:yes gene_type:complete